MGEGSVLKFGLRLLLTVLTLVTFAMASHQVMASMQGVVSCADASHIDADEPDENTADRSHCSPCCHAAQALPLLSDASAFEPAEMSTVVQFPEHADVDFGSFVKPFRPPRLA